MTCLLAVINTNTTKFWEFYFGIVDRMNKYAPFGILDFQTVRELVDIVANVLFITVADETDENESISPELITMWFRTLDFVNCVLSNSVKWAKSFGNAAVRSLVNQAYALSGFLANYHARLSKASPELLAAELPRFKASFKANFRWFLSVDGELRMEAVLLVRKLLQIAKVNNWDVGSSAQKQIDQMLSGKIKTHLSEKEVALLKSWETEIDEQAEEIIETGERTVMPSASVSSAPPSSRKENTNYNFTPSSQTWDSAKDKWNVLSKMKNSSSIKIRKKTVKSGSKLQMLKQEVMVEKRNVVNPVAKPEPPRPAREIGDSSAAFKNLVTEDSPEKPKRQMKVIDLPNVRPSALQRNVDSVTAPKMVRVGDIANIHKKILQWSFPSEGDLPPNFDYDLKKIPNAFSSVQEYASIFEPLLLLECWEHLVKAKDEVIEDDVLNIKINSTTAVDGFYGTFPLL